MQTLTVNKLRLMKKSAGTKVAKTVDRTPDHSQKLALNRHPPSADDSVEGLRDVSATEQIKTPKLEPSQSEQTLPKQLP